MRRGFNIIELIVMLSIVAIISAIVLPKAAGFIDAIEVRAAVTEIESLFSTARHLAIARGAQSTLEIDPARGSISVLVGPDTIQHHEVELAHGVTLTSTRTSITYSPTGIGYGAGNLSLVVTRNLTTDTIFVSRLGRVRH